MAVPTAAAAAAPAASRARRGSARRTSLSWSLLDGATGSAYVALTTGSLLTGYLIHLGAGDQAFAWVTALGVFAQATPLLAARLVRGSRKRLTCLWLGLSRLLWIPLATLSVVDPSPGRVTAFVALVGCSRILDALGQNTWMGWMAGLVPARIRGRYFARRNAICVVTGVAASLAASSFVDRCAASAASFGLTFGCAFLLAAASLSFLALQPEPEPEPAATRTPGSPAGPGPAPRTTRKVPAPALRRFVDLYGDAVTVPVSRHTRPVPVLAQAAASPDGRFARFLAFMGLWGLLNGFASPFWNMFALVQLKLSLTTLALISAIGALVGAVFLPLWGSLADRVGHRRVLIVTMAWGSLHPLLYLFMSPDRIWPFWIDAVSSGIVWNGFELSVTNLLLSLAPKQGGERHFGALTAVRGISGAVAAALSGLLVDRIPAVTVLGVALSRYQIVFGATTVLRWVCLAATGLVVEQRSGGSRGPDGARP